MIKLYWPRLATRQ